MRYVTVVVIVAAVAFGTSGASAQRRDTPTGSDFTRIFGHLPAFAQPTPRVKVFIGLLRADRDSILKQAAPFVPTLGPVIGEFRMIDLLRIAGVDQKR